MDELADSDSQQIAEPASQYLIAEPETEHASVSKPWLFKPGQTGNPNGRPKRGQTAPEKLRAQLDRRADKIIDGVLTAAEKGNVRAFVAAMDRAYGVPAQKLVIENANDPAGELLLRLMTARGLVATDPGPPALPAPTDPPS